MDIKKRGAAALKTNRVHDGEIDGPSEVDHVGLGHVLNAMLVGNDCWDGNIVTHEKIDTQVSSELAPIIRPAETDLAKQALDGASEKQGKQKEKKKLQMARDHSPAADSSSSLSSSSDSLPLPPEPLSSSESSSPRISALICL